MYPSFISLEKLKFKTHLPLLSEPDAYCKIPLFANTLSLSSKSTTTSSLDVVEPAIWMCAFESVVIFVLPSKSIPFILMGVLSLVALLTSFSSSDVLSTFPKPICDGVTPCGFSVSLIWSCNACSNSSFALSKSVKRFDNSSVTFVLHASSVIKSRNFISVAKEAPPAIIFASFLKDSASFLKIRAWFFAAIASLAFLNASFICSIFIALILMSSIFSFTVSIFSIIA